MAHRFYFKKNRPVNTAEKPPVGFSFGIIDRFIGRMFPDGNFEYIFLAERYEIGYVIREAIKTSLMFRAYHLTIDRDLGIGHHTVEYQRDLLALIGCGNRKSMAINALLHTRIFQPPYHTRIPVLILIPSSVSIFTESLQLPLRRDFDFFPFAAVAAFGAIKIPLHRISESCTRQIYFTGFLRSDRKKKAGTERS